MKLYWVNAIIQDEHDKRAWLCTLTDSCCSMENAIEALDILKSQHIVLAAWIDYTDERGSRIVFFDCYVNALGYTNPTL